MKKVIVLENDTNVQIYQLINPLTYYKKLDLAMQTNRQFSEKLSYWRDEKEKEPKVTHYGASRYFSTSEE